MLPTHILIENLNAMEVNYPNARNKRVCGQGVTSNACSDSCEHDATNYRVPGTHVH